MTRVPKVRVQPSSARVKEAVRAYPFLFIGHGKDVDLEAINKSEEVFAWFTRAVTPRERATIQDGAPSPLKSLFEWGECFAYFGSAGDTFDFEVGEKYGYNSETGLKRFAQDFENWAQQIHALVPLTLIMAPNFMRLDALSPWGKYSEKALPAVLLQIIKQRPNDSSAKYFDYIASILAQQASNQKGFDNESRIAIIEQVFKTDGLHGPYERLTHKESTLLHNAAQVTALLKAAKPEARRAVFEALSPYVRLAYFASYDALKTAIPLYSDLHVEVSKLLCSVSVDRQDVAATLGLHLANNLVQRAPAFDKENKQKALLAAQVLAAVAEHPAASREVFQHGYEFFMWAKDKVRAEALALLGSEKFPGMAKQRPRDAWLVVNESFHRLTKGDLAGGYSVLREYIDAGGDRDLRVWTNMFNCHMLITPKHDLYDATKVASDFAAVGAWLSSEKPSALLADLVMNATNAAGNHDRYELGIELIERHVNAIAPPLQAENKLWILFQSYTWCGYSTKDRLLHQRVYERFKNDFLPTYKKAIEAMPGAIHNFVGVCVHLGERETLFEMLNHLKALEYKELSTMTDDVLAPLKNDPDVIAFYAS